MIQPIHFAGHKLVIHPSWQDFCDNRIRFCLEEIEKRIGDDFTPKAEYVLRFFALDLSHIKIVILGQDPYPQPDVATGRAFEVSGVTDWDMVKGNTSLQNIIKLLHKSAKSRSLPASIDEVRRSIRRNEFKVLPPHQIFQHWEDQGVLLLNTALTCKIGLPMSHSNYWACFSQRVVDFIAERAPSATWFLWGGNAKRFGINIDRLRKHESDHPRLHSQAAGSFLGQNHFGIDLDIDWTGKTEPNEVETGEKRSP